MRTIFRATPAAALLTVLGLLLVGVQAQPKPAPAIGGIGVAVINSYWATETGFWTRIMLKNGGTKPATVSRQPFTIKDDRGAEYEFTEPSENFALAGVRLNPGQEHLAVIACEVGPEGKARKFTLHFGTTKIPLKIDKPGKKP